MNNTVEAYKLEEGNRSPVVADNYRFDVMGGDLAQSLALVCDSGVVGDSGGVVRCG